MNSLGLPGMKFLLPTQKKSYFARAAHFNWSFWEQLQHVLYSSRWTPAYS